MIYRNVDLLNYLLNYIIYMPYIARWVYQFVIINSTKYRNKNNWTQNDNSTDLIFFTDNNVSGSK